jgi:hypothetical protein
MIITALKLVGLTILYTIFIPVLGLAANAVICAAILADGIERLR